MSCRCSGRRSRVSRRKSSSEEELDERGWHREQRRHAWTHGRGSPLEACIAKLAYPPVDPAFLKTLVALAWTPHYAAILRTILDEAARNDDPDGYARALESARLVWNDIWSEPAKSLGTPPNDEHGKLLVWLNFNVALAKAQKDRPKPSKAAVERDFVRHKGKHQRIPLNTVANLRKILRQAECLRVEVVDGRSRKEVWDGMLELKIQALEILQLRKRP
jgi:hypothetical protein